MFLTGQQIIDLGIIDNPRPKFTCTLCCVHNDTDWHRQIKLTGGIEPSAYGLTLASYTIIRPQELVLANTAERLNLPSCAVLPIVGQTSIVGYTVNKSTWVRLGLLQPNTDMEAGWCGHLTLELFNASDKTIYIPAGAPIVTARFSCTLGVVDAYTGKYQNQPNHPIEAK